MCAWLTQTYNIVFFQSLMCCDRLATAQLVTWLHKIPILSLTLMVASTAITWRTSPRCEIQPVRQSSVRLRIQITRNYLSAVLSTNCADDQHDQWNMPEEKTPRSGAGWSWCHVAAKKQTISNALITDGMSFFYWSWTFLGDFRCFICTCICIKGKEKTDAK